jgi:hypothetical protein
LKPSNGKPLFGAAFFMREIVFCPHKVKALARRKTSRPDPPKSLVTLAGGHNMQIPVNVFSKAVFTAT